MAVTWTSRLDKIARDAPLRAQRAVDRAGQSVEAGAKRRARVDTGAMRDAIQYVRSGPFEGEVVGPVEWTPYNEYGTVKKSAQPMFGPAAEETRPAFYADMSHTFD